MRSSVLSATALTLLLGACAPGLRPIVDAAPDHSGSPELVLGNAGDGDGYPAVRGPSAARSRPDASYAAPRRAAPAVSSDATAVTWDIDVTSYAQHESVERYVQLFAGRASESTAKRLQRGTRYEPLIRGKLREAGLPEDLYYLAFVESGFDPHAYSRAAAVGLWQFMTTTARAVGMQVDWWVDDRRDPVRSTDGAVRHLRDLRRQFDGSLYLAAAAYNGGSGRISRLLAAHADAVDGHEGDDRFFALSETGQLRAETREYVPQLIAVAMIGKTPSAHGISVTPLPPLAYDSVMVPPATPLAAVAQVAGVELGEVTELNGRYLRGMTPPTGEWDVRLPAGTATGVLERLAELPDSMRVGVRRVKVEKSEKPAALAKRHGLSERQLSWYNPGLERTKKGNVVVGQALLVPTPATMAAALNVADPAVEIYGTSPEPASAPKVHEVKAGDSLDRIARQYGLTVTTLKALNGLQKDLIRPGQKLTVSGEPARASGGKGKATPQKAATR